MLSTTLRFYLSIACIMYFVLIIFFLRKKALSLKYTLLWLFAGVSMGGMILFPQILQFIIEIVDIKSIMNGLFAISIFFILVILMSLTSIVSKQNEKLKNLVQDNAFLEKRIRDLENNK